MYSCVSIIKNRQQSVLFLYSTPHAIITLISNITYYFVFPTEMLFHDDFHLLIITCYYLFPPIIDFPENGLPGTAGQPIFYNR